ncbi:MAG: class I SAM-dependent methyltransferase, partial [Limisphaerales bacterium]
MNWTEGYLTEGYIFGYFRELSPDNLRLACLSAGLAPPTAKPLRYLELGYGQGIPINIHAAAAPGEYWGTDFNPTQTAFAHSLADGAGSDVVLLNDSFSELAARSELPKFDIIALHGIWTWVSEENHRIIVDIIKRNLQAGGVVYISYNCLPGWAPAAPLRHLVKLYGELASSDIASVEDKLIAGAKFTQQVVDAGAHYFRDHPNVVEVLNSLIATDPHYLSHEYFTKAWYLMTFSDMARTLGNAKLTFATSATIFEHVDSINFSSQGQGLLAKIGNPILRQSVRDYLVNQQFRRDIFINGPRQLAPSERWEMLRAELFVLASNPDDIPMRIISPTGEIKLKEQIYRPLIEVLAEENYAPKTLGQLAGHGKLRSLEISEIFEALLVLTGSR